MIDLVREVTLERVIINLSIGAALVSALISLDGSG